jgi:hypothetical protein
MRGVRIMVGLVFGGWNTFRSSARPRAVRSFTGSCPIQNPPRNWPG